LGVLVITGPGKLRDHRRHGLLLLGLGGLLDVSEEPGRGPTATGQK